MNLSQPSLPSLKSLSLSLIYLTARAPHGYTPILTPPLFIQSHHKHPLSLFHSQTPSSSSSSSSSSSRKKKMCMNSAEWEASNALFSTMRKQRTKRSRIRIHRLTRRKQQRSYEEEVDMELKNLKLYMKNISILEENDKLRKKASLLHQENLALMSEFHKKISSFDPICTK